MKKKSEMYFFLLFKYCISFSSWNGEKRTEILPRIIGFTQFFPLSSRPLPPHVLKYFWSDPPFFLLKRWRPYGRPLIRLLSNFQHHFNDFWWNHSLKNFWVVTSKWISVKIIVKWCRQMMLTIMPKTFIPWKSIWIYLKSQIVFWNLKI